MNDSMDRLNPSIPVVQAKGKAEKLTAEKSQDSLYLPQLPAKSPPTHPLQITAELAGSWTTGGPLFPIFPCLKRQEAAQNAVNAEVTVATHWAALGLRDTKKAGHTYLMLTDLDDDFCYLRQLVIS